MKANIVAGLVFAAACIGCATFATRAPLNVTGNQPFGIDTTEIAAALAAAVKAELGVNAEADVEAAVGLAVEAALLKVQNTQNFDPVTLRIFVLGAAVLYLFAPYFTGRMVRLMFNRVTGRAPAPPPQISS